MKLSSYIISRSLIILWIIILVLAFIANISYDIGYNGGYSQAILDGYVEIQCNFPRKE